MKCPNCGKSKPAPAGHRRWKCNRCGVLFDDAPAEGGDYDDQHVDARLLRAEDDAQRNAKHARRPAHQNDRRR